jgi:hypothetical protein
MQTGSVRVGRCIFRKSGGYDFPEFPDHDLVVVLTKTSKFGMLGPYCLRDKQGRIMENIWQFSKVYHNVPKVKVPFTVRNPKIVWKYDAETHTDAATPESKPNDKYWKWRDAGMDNDEAVRYPVGKMAHTCLYALDQRDVDAGIHNPLTYVQARKDIYLRVYCELARTRPEFKDLQDRLKSGKNLLITETDGPHQESLQYYQDTYHVDEHFIENHSMPVNLDNIKIMMHDTKHPFGHGYCLAAALLEIDAELLLH